MQIDTAQRSAMERQQQAERQRAQRYSQCKLEEAQMWFEPGSEGFGLGKVQMRIPANVTDDSGPS
jgi:hypothetical protein